MTRYGCPAARKRRSLHPVMAAVRPKTFTMAVPWESAGRTLRPQITSATRRPLPVGDVGQRDGEDPHQLNPPSRPRRPRHRRPLRWYDRRRRRRCPRAGRAPARPSPARRDIGPDPDGGDYDVAGDYPSIGQHDAGVGHLSDTRRPSRRPHHRPPARPRRARPARGRAESGPGQPPRQRWS